MLIVRFRDDSAESEGYPERSWHISIFLVGADGEELPATCFEKATYVLHESFGLKRMKQGRRVRDNMRWP